MLTRAVLPTDRARDFQLEDARRPDDLMGTEDLLPGIREPHGDVAEGAHLLTADFGDERPQLLIPR
jgi:hypothetical protein